MLSTKKPPTDGRPTQLRHIMLGVCLASLMTLTGCHPQGPFDASTAQRTLEPLWKPAADVIRIDDKDSASLLHQTSTATLGHEIELAQLARSMRTLATRHQADGLAAIQLGIPTRFILLRRGTGRHTSRLDAMADPTVLSRDSRTIGSWERCLSVPWGYRYTERAASLRVRYRTIDGRWRQEAINGGEAVVLQHELDHLDGKLVSDEFSQRDFVPEAQIAKVAAAADTDCRMSGKSDCTAFMRTRWLEHTR